MDYGGLYLTRDEEFCHKAFRVARRPRLVAPAYDGDVVTIKRYNSFGPKVSDDFETQVRFWSLVLDGLSKSEAARRIEDESG